MVREAAEKALITIAKHSAATWRLLRGEAFVGKTTIETANTIYRFEDGVFSARAPRTASTLHTWESPPNMRGVELIGFLTEEGGLWSLSSRWRPGALAVISTNGNALTLTSPTLACRIERPAPAPPRVLPSVRRPAPPSMTRLQAAPAR